jgi:hypothetical protein
MKVMTRKRSRAFLAGFRMIYLAENNKIRLMTKVARVCHTQAIRQTEITQRLSLQRNL